MPLLWPVSRAEARGSEHPAMKARHQKSAGQVAVKSDLAFMV